MFSNGVVVIAFAVCLVQSAPAGQDVFKDLISNDRVFEYFQKMNGENGQSDENFGTFLAKTAAGFREWKSKIQDVSSQEHKALVAAQNGNEVVPVDQKELINLYVETLHKHINNPAVGNENSISQQLSQAESAPPSLTVSQTPTPVMSNPVLQQQSTPQDVVAKQIPNISNDDLLELERLDNKFSSQVPNMNNIVAPNQVSPVVVNGQQQQIPVTVQQPAVNQPTYADQNAVTQPKQNTGPNQPSGFSNELLNELDRLDQQYPNGVNTITINRSSEDTPVISITTNPQPVTPVQQVDSFSQQPQPIVRNDQPPIFNVIPNQQPTSPVQAASPSINQPVVQNTAIQQSQYTPTSNKVLNQDQTLDQSQIPSVPELNRNVVQQPQHQVNQPQIPPVLQVNKLSQVPQQTVNNVQEPVISVISNQQPNLGIATAQSPVGQNSNQQSPNTPTQSDVLADRYGLPKDVVAELDRLDNINPNKVNPTLPADRNILTQQSQSLNQPQLVNQQQIRPVSGQVVSQTRDQYTPSQSDNQQQVVSVPQTFNYVQQPSVGVMTQAPAPNQQSIASVLNHPIQNQLQPVNRPQTMNQPQPRPIPEQSVIQPQNVRQPNLVDQPHFSNQRQPNIVRELDSLVRNSGSVNHQTAQHPSEQTHSPAVEHPKDYSFSTTVDDDIVGNYQQHVEERKNGRVYGKYSYDDGNNFITRYYIADAGGFRIIKELTEPSKRTGHVLSGKATVHVTRDGVDNSYAITKDDIHACHSPKLVLSQ